jgi:heme A synthase
MIATRSPRASTPQAEPLPDLSRTLNIVEVVEAMHAHGGSELLQVAGCAALIYARGVKLTGHAKNSAKAVAIITVLQVFLGIVTLVLVAPPLLAALHQVMAALLLCAAVWHAFELKRL